MWKRLLNAERIGFRGRSAPDPRSAFQRDFDRIIFSSAFRRLQDKTQVFPLPSSDYVRTRLTHSLEVATVGRSLGVMVGKVLQQRHRGAFRGLESGDIGALVAAACLAHDIGNPPFGHSGESAIQSWFQDPMGRQYINKLRPREAADLLAFEGNAQGLRTLVRLQSPDNLGGLQLTYATLGAFLKYPSESTVKTDRLRSSGQSTKKHGYFQSEREVVQEIAEKVGLVWRSASPRVWARHPMAFLMEAADDISYRIIDFEDGYRLGHLTYAETSAHLLRFFKEREKKAISARLRSIGEDKERVEYLRARAVNHLIHQVVEVFLDEEKNILNGSFDSEIVAVIPSADVLRSIRELSRQKVYTAREVLEIEAAGFDVLGGLLTYLVPAVLEGRLGKKSPRKSSAKYFELLPARARANCQTAATNDYERLLLATDFISGMTDSYAVTLFKMLKGISLPTT